MHDHIRVLEFTGGKDENNTLDFATKGLTSLFLPLGIVGIGRYDICVDNACRDETVWTGGHWEGLCRACVGRCEGRKRELRKIFGEFTGGHWVCGGWYMEEDK